VGAIRLYFYISRVEINLPGEEFILTLLDDERVIGDFKLV